MKRGIIFVIMLMALSSFVLAEPVALSELEGQEIGGPAANLINNQRVVVHIVGERGVTGENGIEPMPSPFSVVIEDKKFASFAPGAVEKPTLEVWIDASLEQEIDMSQDPTALLFAGLDDGRVTYKAYGFFNKIKIGLLIGGAKTAYKKLGDAQ